MTYRKSGDIARSEPPELIDRLRYHIENKMNGYMRVKMPSGYIVKLSKSGSHYLLQAGIKAKARSDAPGGYVLALAKILLGEYPWMKAPPRTLKTRYLQAEGLAVASIEIMP